MIVVTRQQLDAPGLWRVCAEIKQGIRFCIDSDDPDDAEQFVRGVAQRALDKIEATFDEQKEATS